MVYKEERNAANCHKEAYVAGLQKLIDQRQKEAAAIRRGYVRDLFVRQEDYRKDLKAMLGWPLVGHSCAAAPKVTCEELSREDGFTLYRMGFEILDGVTMTGLLCKMDGQGPKPLVIVQHGGQGTPELVCGALGSTTNYKDMLQQVTDGGAHAFLPQLLLWHENYGVTYDRRSMDARLKRVGSSITAVEVFGLTRILDWFEEQNYAKNFGMVGLSYGGFYTLMTAALDTRILSAVSCSYFNTRDAYPWSDWVWQRSAELFDDAEIACLVYPRKLYLAMGDRDELFDHNGSEAAFRKIRELCRTVGTDWVQYATFPGKHEFLPDTVAVDQLIKHLA